MITAGKLHTLIIFPLILFCCFSKNIQANPCFSDETDDFHSCISDLYGSSPENEYTSITKPILEPKDSLDGRLILSFDLDYLNQASQDSISREIITELNRKGFLKAFLDSVMVKNGSTFFYFDTGSEYTYYLKSFRINGELSMKLAGINSGQQFSFIQFGKVTEKLLDHYGNIGFPFARINKDDIHIDESIIRLNLDIETGEQIIIDSLSVRGTARISSHFLENLLGIKPGMAFNKKLIDQANQKLSELDFVRMTAPPAVVFAPGRATLILPLDSEPSSRFDGMAGVSGGGEQDLPVRLTGMLNFYLSNALALGEYLDFSWQGPGNSTQILSIDAGYPYPFRLPIETNVLFSLHKQDTSWLQLRFRPGLMFDVSSRSKAGIFWHYNSNSLIANRFPSQPGSEALDLDFQLNLYGIEYRYQTRAFFRQLISRGFMARVNVAAGNRQIKRNVNAPPSLYENREMKTTQLNLSGKFEKRWKTGTRATLSLGGDLQYQSGKDFPLNQLERLGGFRTLRGFDELSFSASSWSFTHLEFRFFTGPESFFNVFINGGWYERKPEGNYYRDFPVGFGVGTNLQTRAGVFSIIAALGMARDMPAEPRNAKIHIGYVTGF